MKFDWHKLLTGTASITVVAEFLLRLLAVLFLVFAIAWWFYWRPEMERDTMMPRRPGPERVWTETEKDH